MKKPKTIADRIRKMSDEELGVFLWRIENHEVDYGITFCDLCDETLDCKQCLKVWLSRDYDVETWGRDIATKGELKEVW